MKASYSLLFSVTITHDYFTNGKINDIVIKPDTQTQKWLSTFNFIFKLTETGFDVFYDTLSYNSQQLHSYEGKTLSFTLNTLDTDFFKYTNLPGYTKNSCLYFSNASPKAQSKKTSVALPLSAKQVVGEKDVYQLIPSDLTYSFAGKSGTNDMSLTNLKKQEINPVAINETTVTYPNLNGIYFIKNSTGTVPCLANNIAYTTKPLGIIEIFLYTPKINVTYSILNKSDITAKHFVIGFEACSATWRYNIINQHTSVNGLSIQSTNTKIKFVREATTTSQIPAYVLMSSSAIKMQHYPKDSFSLDIKRDSGRNVYNNLPVPSIESLKIENKANYLDAYIYL